MHLRPLRIFSLVSLTVLVLAPRATAQPAVIEAHTASHGASLDGDWTNRSDRSRRD